MTILLCLNLKGFKKANSTLILSKLFQEIQLAKIIINY